VAGLEQPARHVRTHIAETDEADVHEACLLLSSFSSSCPASCRLVPGMTTFETPRPQIEMAGTSPAMTNC
jgi:hypothetical protein